MRELLIATAMTATALVLFVGLPLFVGWRLWVRDGGREEQGSNEPAAKDAA